MPFPGQGGTVFPNSRSFVGRESFALIDLRATVFKLKYPNFGIFWLPVVRCVFIEDFEISDEEMKPARLILVLLILSSLLEASAADWPQWRGPNRDDLSKEKGLLKSWPEGGPKQVWLYTNAGNSYSGPAIVGNKF